MGAFDDLIPAQAPAPSGAFDDLVPANSPTQTDSGTNIFDDLIPKQTPALDVVPSGPSSLGVAGRTVLRGVGPMAAFVAAAPRGAAIGAAAGAAIPGLDATGIPEVVGGFLGGIIAGTGAAWAAHKAQSSIADTIQPSDKNPFSTVSEQEDIQAHPIVSELSNLLVVGKPNPLNIIRAARTLASDEGRSALSSLAQSAATKDGYKAWQEATDPALQKQALNVLNVAQAGGINAAFNAYDQIQSGNYSFPDLVRSAAEGTLFNQPWIHAANPATQKFDEGFQKTQTTEIPDANQIQSRVALPGQPEATGVQKTGAGQASEIPEPATIPVGQPPAPPNALKPDPNWRVTVQAPQVMPDGITTVPGYVQIDDVTGGKNVWSSGPDKLAAQGYQIPDFSKLPAGQYTFGQAEKLVQPPVAPTTIIKGVVATPVDADTHIVSVNNKDVAVVKFVDDAQQAQPSIGATGWEGYFIARDPQTQQPTIYINRQYVDRANPIFTHETTHLLESMGLITPEQIASVVDTYGKDIAPEVATRYQEFNQKNNLPPPTAEDIQREVFANVFQKWHAEDNAPKVTWIQRAIDFVRGIIKLDKTGRAHAQDILKGKFQEPAKEGAVSATASAAPTKEQDASRYAELVASLKGKSMDEAQPILKEIEAIKNRNGGMVPKIVQSVEGFSQATPEHLTPEEALQSAGRVKVTAPSSHIRVVGPAGSEVHQVNKINSGDNPLVGQEIQKVHGVRPGTGTTKGQFVPVKGEVKVKPQFSVPKDQTETPEFKAWFGDSKVVDENGRPLVVYHGTRSEPFYQFDESKIGSQTDNGWLGRGFYFSTDADQVGAWFAGMGKTPRMSMELTAEDREAWTKRMTGKGGLGAFYLSMKNPLILKPDGFGFDKRNLIRSSLGLPKTASPDEITFKLKAEGYDGVILDYSNTGYNHNEVMALSPSQIKSATGNTGAFNPANPDIRFSVPQKRAQVGGIPEVGQERDTESIADNQRFIRENLFDSTKPVSDAQTASAWQVFGEMTSPNKATFGGQILDRFGNSRLVLPLYKGEVWRYARKLAIHGDDSLLRAMYDHSQDFETLGNKGGGASTVGSSLRAEAENAGDAVNVALKNAFEYEREQAAQKGSGVDRETFFRLLERLRGIKLTPEEVQKVVDEGILPNGKTLEETVEENTAESQEAKKLLDKYQRSQTEWLKPEFQKSIIRVIVDAAIGENKLARYGEADFKSRLSQRLQGATVPKEVADELAHEVWKDKSAREATKTDKAVKEDAQFEQKRAQSILDKLQSQQTEVFTEARRSKVADIIKAFYRNPVAEGAQRTEITRLEQDLVHAGASEKAARELAYEAGQRKRVLESNRRLELDKVTDNEAQKLAEDKLKELENQHSGVEWLKKDTAKSRVQKIISDALKIGNGSRPIDSGSLENAVETSKQLVDAGVDKATADKLAQEIENERQTKFINRRTQQLEVAAGSKSLRSLIEDILSQPYRAQSDPKWLHDTSVRWFESNGLSKEQAEAATRLFQDKFRAAFEAAATKIAQKELAKAPPKTFDDMERLIRAGIFNPDKDWVDQLAAKTGWVKPTKAQMERLNELEEKASNPSLSPEEVASVKEQQFGILRHVGKKDGQSLRALGEAFTGSLLSGIRTLTVQMSPVIQIFREFSTAALADPKNMLNFARAIYNSYKANAKSAFKYAWQKDAYGFHLGELEHGYNELKRIAEQTDDVIKSKDASLAKKGGAYALKLYALQRYVFRTLNSLDQTSMAVTREWKLAYYSAQAFKAAGLGPKDVRELVDRVAMVRQNEYDKARDSGLDDDTAQVRANSRVERAVWDFVRDATGEDALADQVLKASENDVYSVVGRIPEGLKPTDEGLLSRYLGFNWFTQKLSEFRGKGGLENIGATALFGMVNIPFRTTRYFSDFSPYGLLRYGIYKYRLNRGKENLWQQSYGNALQARARLEAAIAGTIAMGVAIAWGTKNHSSDKNAGDEDFGLYITGAGPNNKVIADAWAKRGFKQYSMNVVIGGHIVAIPLTRVGESLMYPFIPVAAMDDYSWRAKEAAASGKPLPNPISTEAATMIGEYIQMTGQRGILQTFGQLEQAYQSGGSLQKTAAKMVTGTAAAAILPFKQLLQSVSDMFVGSLDNSSIQSIVANQFPIVGLPFQTRAINRFGDPLYDRTWFGIISRTGVPVAFQVERNPVNQQLYTALVNAGASPPPLQRSTVESQYGEMTDEQFNQFSQISGSTLKNAINSQVGQLGQMNPVDAKKLFDKLAVQANAAAASQMGLTKISQPAAPQVSAAPAVASAKATRQAGSTRGRSRTLFKSPRRQRIGTVSRKKAFGSHRSLYGVNHRRLYGV